MWPQGKSLSLICGSLTWLREHKGKLIQARLDEADVDDGEPAWVREYAKEEQKQKILGERNELEERLKAIRRKEQRDRERSELATGNAVKRVRRDLEVEREGEDDDEFVPEDYESDEESKTARGAVSHDGDGFSAATRELMKRYDFPPREAMHKNNEG